MNGERTGKANLALRPDHPEGRQGAVFTMLLEKRLPGTEQKNLSDQEKSSKKTRRRSPEGGAE